jgi:hypothetical protein
VDDDVDAFVEATRQVLADTARASASARPAREHVSHYSWRTASTSMHLLLRRAASGLPATSVCDPTAAPETKHDRRRPDRAARGRLDGRGPARPHPSGTETPAATTRTRATGLNTHPPRQVA